MLKQLSLLLTCCFFYITSAFATVEENYVDFPISYSVISNSQIHLGLEWLAPHEFSQKDIRVIDRVRLSLSNPKSNHLIASKVGLISKRKFSDLSYSSINQSSFISKMLNSVSVTSKSGDSWRVVNKVKAYGLPFNVGFDLKISEVPLMSAPSEVLQYLRDESRFMKSQGQERLMVIDMTNFSQLMYRNYSYVYMKEIGPSQTLIVATLAASFNVNKADNLFNFPPFSTTQETMISNLRTQVLQMAKSIQK